MMDGKTKLKQFGNRVREIRKQKGFSQEGFANDCEMSRSFYSQVEGGIRNITILNIFKIADGLSVDPIELFKPPIADEADIKAKIESKKRSNASKN